MKYLCLIPARGGSKGIPRKNIRPLGGKPLIYFSLNIALQLSDTIVCVSTDDEEIAEIVRNYGVDIPFMRPPELAADSTPSRDVIIHALDFYQKIGITFTAIILLQPTSPFRLLQHVNVCLSKFNPTLDMVVSVKKSLANPYYNLFEEDTGGFLVKSKPGNFKRRQDCPPVFEVNGSVYIINPDSIREKDFANFSRIIKYEMPSEYSVDIDEPIDWELAELLIEKGMIK
jgi:N-acylneuraminate cytidylyltransferase